MKKSFVHAVLAAVTLSCSPSDGGGTDIDSVTPTSPPPSAGHDLVYHDRLGAVILVNAGLGGMDDAQRAGQRTKVWAWRGERWELLDSVGPPVRNLGGVAYDRARDVIVLYGGTFSESRSYGDTWEWGASGWRQVDVPGPGIRHHAQMVYDEANRRIVLASGQGEALTFPTDVWSYDGSAWTRITNEGVARVHHTLVYDARRQKVLLIGGNSPDGGSSGETLELDGAVWRANPALSINPRAHARAVFIESTGELMLVGGTGSASGDVLVAMPQAWQSQNVQRPPARYLTAVAYDRNRRVVVLFGGGNNSGLLDDTWEWDGQNWRSR